MVVLAQNYRQMLADSMLSWTVSLVFFVLGAWGLYTLAKRRGIQKAWLAWIPIADLYVLGSISNQFRKSFPFRKTVFRFALVLLAVLSVASWIAMAVVGLGFFLPAVEETIGLDFWEFYTYTMSGDPDQLMAYMEDLTAQLQPDDGALEALLGVSMLMVVVSFVSAGLSIAVSVLEYICLYDLFSSCKPNLRVAFLLIALFLGAKGLMIFLCRNSDEGLEAVRRMPRPAPWQPQPMPQNLPPHQNDGENS